MSGTIKLVWAVAFMLQGQQTVVPVSENAKFKDVATCEIFGAAMTPRMEDWVRGRLQADWDYPVAIKFQCSADGDPA